MIGSIDFSACMGGHENQELIFSVIKSMKTSRVSNYVIPGLDSFLLGAGTVRLFECSRYHQESITPHSHRYDFFSIVLQGEVRNTIWLPAKRVIHDVARCNLDLYQTSKLKYIGGIGQHEKTECEQSRWMPEHKSYSKGQMYSMSSNDVHSIAFSKRAKVLIFEGPDVSDTSMIIEPVVNGEVARTYETKDYMFLTDKNEE